MTHAVASQLHLVFALLQGYHLLFYGGACAAEQCTADALGGAWLLCLWVMCC